MKNKKLVVIICMLVTASVFSIVTSSLASDGNIIYVDDAPPEWYDATHVRTIQEGSMPMQNHIINEQDNNITISIQGGLGISFEICNYGNTTLYLVNWSITIDGTLVLFGGSISGSISAIPPGECVTIGTRFIFGIGTINVTVQINDISKSANGYLIGPFVLF